MAENLGSQNLQGTVEERTWRITCFCENGTDYSLEAHRERVLVDANGATLATLDRDLPTVKRFVSQVINDRDALDFLQLAKNLCDKWAAEDAAAGEVNDVG